MKSYIITGPTASGKSDFAHKLAARIDGVIINADSVQLYDGIENISASPMADDKRPMSDVEYKLFSVLPLTKQISVVDYLQMVRDVMPDDKAVVFVGGTGFYINAILNGISPMPEISDEIRARARMMVAKKNDTGLDSQRAARALEILLETGKPIEYWQSLPRVGAIAPDAIKILINPPADVLRERIASRILQMINGGAVDEARNIPSGCENRAIGAIQLCKYLSGELSMDDAIKNWTDKTNQYAKRQRTWFRTQFSPDIIINRIPSDADIPNV